MEYLQYTTTGQERWDNIAYNAYGDAGMSRIIIEANPDVAIDDILLPGIVLRIPIISEATTIINSDILPPWKVDL